MSDGHHIGELNSYSFLGSSDDGTNSDFYDSRQSPPKAIVDSSPLQPAMDKNKESLKVKLMVRRPFEQLVEQGIIPPLKTSPAIHEQCKQLERAKTGDLLKAKIQQRPNREELERRHILEHDESHVDPSLAEKQRMLKKARLADSLNSQIQHRPGVLELIQKNILHTEEPLENIVKAGYLPFKATREGQSTLPQHPSKYVNFEDDSQSSESSDTRNTPPRSGAGSSTLTNVLEEAGIVTVALTIPTNDGQLVVTSAPIIQTKFQTNNSLVSYVPQPPPPPPLPPAPTSIYRSKETTTSNLFAELCQSVTGSAGGASPNYIPLMSSPVSLGSSASTLSPLSSISSPPQSLTPRPPSALQISYSSKSDAPGKEKNRKKSNKSKPVSKAKTIKFHEYKGPPNAQKNSSSSSFSSSSCSSDLSSTKETPYQLLLDQQNCFLRCLETLQKNQTIPEPPAPPPLPLVPAESPVPMVAQHTPRPPPMPSPALSVCSSIPPPPSPATSYAESMCSTSTVGTTIAPTIISDIGKLEKMKVSDLKMQLKKRNLPVSGPKPQLIERLKPYLPLEPILPEEPHPVIEMIVSSPLHAMSPESVVMTEPTESMEIVQQQIESPLQYAPPQPTSISQPKPQTATIISIGNDDLVREQQRKILELQRQLEKSQQELQQIKQNQQKKTEIVQVKHPIVQHKAQKSMQLQVQPAPVPVRVPEPIVPPTPPIVTTKTVVKQQLEAKILKTQKAAAAKAQMQAQAQAAAQAALMAKSKQEKSPPPQTTTFLTTKSSNNYGLLSCNDGTILLVNLPDKKIHLNGHQRASSMPSIVFPIQATQAPPGNTKPAQFMTQNKPHHQPAPPPPLYEEAVNVQQTMKNKKERQHVKSENLTDVLDILIKNGDLPESALNTPIPTPTPTTPNGNNIIMTDLDGNLIFSAPNPPPAVKQPILENIDMASPLQPKHHMDSNNVAKTLDIFLKSPTPSPQLPSQNEANGGSLSTDNYDDFELLELMSQQLDMDMEDSMGGGGGSVGSNASHYNQPDNSASHSRRDMNPSLQPSISDLIQQQDEQHPLMQNCNFDPSNFVDLNSGTSSSTMNSNLNNNYLSTPMDVCDDFDATLANFGFPQLSPVTSTINTPPHPFSSSSTSCGLSAATSSTSSGTGHHNQMESNDSFGGSSSSMMGHDNILDFLNIDDYKMAWGEGDFAV